MVDYKKFLDLGLDAANLAEKNRAEIAQVFDELNVQLHEATHGRVQVDRSAMGSATILNAISALEARTAPYSPQRSYALLAVSSDSPPMTLQIAKWDMDSAGYPCTLGVEGEKWICLDAEALEQSLALMLQQPSVGAAIRQLMGTTSGD
jgi:hypothetical protein